MIYVRSLFANLFNFFACAVIKYNLKSAQVNCSAGFKRLQMSSEQKVRNLCFSTLG